MWSAGALACRSTDAPITRTCVRSSRRYEWGEAINVGCSLPLAEGRQDARPYRGASSLRSHRRSRLAQKQESSLRQRLPNSSSNLQLARHSFTAPLFPFLHKHWKRFSAELCTTKQMHMVGHDDIAPDGPPVAIMRITPFVGQYGCSLICG